MSAPTSTRSGSFSIKRLRTFILIALVAGVTVFTAVMFTLVQRLSERFGPQVQADLEWRALRGAQELAKSAELGLAVSDAEIVAEAFAPYTSSSDIRAIVAIDAAGKVVARHGEAVDPSRLFAAPSGTLVADPGSIASWAPAQIEGGTVGKVAVVVSTRRMSDAQATLSSVSRTTVVAGILGVILGAVVILFFTRAVSQRDAQLNDYAHNLEQKVEARTAELDERNRGMRLVLDNVAQGFVTIDLAGAMASERSAIVDRWFGEPAAGMPFAELVRPHAPEFATWFEIGLDSVRDGIMPLALCLDQMPRRFTAGERTFDVAYSAISRDGTIENLLLIVSDMTQQIVRERAEREQKELVALFQRITGDRAGFEEFLSEATALVASLEAAGDPAVEKRAIHTLKGNCAIYGFERYAELCHEVESQLAELDGGPLPDALRARLIEGWRVVVAQMSRLLGERTRDVIEIDHHELAAVVDQARQGMASRDLAAAIASWSHEAVGRRFERLAQHATGLARRLRKGEPAIEIDDARIRLDGPQWAPFWSAAVHAIRNAVDHGIESPDERRRAGKSARPVLRFAARRAAGQLEIAIGDDGRGIDWAAVRRRAEAAGLPAATRDDLIAALFADGVSTRASATDTSGRGVGMAALRDAVTALGGEIDLETAEGAGTTWRFRFPSPDAQILPVRPPTQPIRRAG